MNRRFVFCICASVFQGAFGNAQSVDRFGTPLPKGAVMRLGMVQDANATGAIANKCYPAFSPNGRWLATAHGSDVIIWNCRTGLVVHRCEGHFYGVNALSFADNNTLYSLGQEKPNAIHMIRLWNVATGKQIRAMRGFEQDHADIFAQRRKFRVVPEYKKTNNKLSTTFTVREIRSRKIVNQTKIAGHIINPDISPDGKIISAFAFEPHPIRYESSHFLRLYDAETGACVRTFYKIGIGDYKKAVFSPDGKKLAAIDADRNISIWETATGRKLATFANDEAYFNYLTFSADGKYIANCTSFGRVFLYDVVNGTRRNLNPGHRTQLTSLAISHDGNWIASGGHGWDSFVIIWNRKDGKVKHRIRLDKADKTTTAQRLAFTPNGKYLLAQKNDKTVMLFDVRTGREYTPFREVGWVYGFSQDGSRVIWSAIELTPLSRYASIPNRSISPANAKVWFGIGQLYFLAQRYPDLCQLRYVPYFLLAQPEESQKIPAAFLFSVSGKQRFPLGLSPAGDTMVEATYVMSGNPFSGMGATWAFAGIRFSEADTGREISRFRLANHVQCMTNDGRSFVVFEYLESTKHAGLSLYETRTCKLRAKMGSCNRDLSNCAVSRDGRLLAFCEREGGLSIFDLSAGKIVYQPSPPVFPRHVAFSRDGKFLISTDNSATILVWNIAHLIRQTPPAKLTKAEQIQLWRNLGDADTQKAFQALMKWKSHGNDAATFFRSKFFDAERNAKITKAIKQLSSKTYSVRQKAQNALHDYGEFARPQLEKELAKTPPLEVTQRVKRLLAKLGTRFSLTTGMRVLRVVEILEHVGTAEAQKLLRDLAVLIPSNPVATEVRQSIARLAKRNQ